MNLPVRRSARRIFMHSLFGLYIVLLSGCVEKSIIIKILKDGSCLIHVRSFSKSLTGTAASVTEQAEETSSNEKIQAKHDAILKELGATVKVQSYGKCSNAAGWQGSELILHCPDINSLNLTPKAIELLFSEGAADFAADEDKEPEVNTDMKLNMKFQLAENQLAILVDWKDLLGKPDTSGRARDPFANRPRSIDPLSAAVYQTILQDLRLGVFVETEREILESNSSYPVEDNALITIMEFDGSQIDMNKNAEMIGRKPTSIEELKKWADDVKGVSVETQPKVIAKLK